MTLNREYGEAYHVLTKVVGQGLAFFQYDSVLIVCSIDHVDFAIFGAVINCTLVYG